jgi:hypothetical protein
VIFITWEQEILSSVIFLDLALTSLSLDKKLVVSDLTQRGCSIHHQS